jgi:Fructose-2,6-bisphosphatase
MTDNVHVEDGNHSSCNHDNCQNSKNKNLSKRIILIRHGCTYMNEYLSKEGCRWGDPHFTDIFEPRDHPLYRDSPLSKRGKAEALRLRDYLQRTENGRRLVQDIEIIAISPLRRALETAELAVIPHFSSDENEDGNGNGKKEVPIVALPLASERVYLISDHGSCKRSLAEKYPFADFRTEFKRFRDEWWFTVRERMDSGDGVDGNDDDDGGAAFQTKEGGDHTNYHSFTSMSIDNYVEWRPNGRGQRYSSHGEPSMAFEERMMALYKWLEEREENVICLISHWGVMGWLTGEDFDNCEIRDVPFEHIRAKREIVEHSRCSNN